MARYHLKVCAPPADCRNASLSPPCWVTDDPQLSTDSQSRCSFLAAFLLSQRQACSYGNAGIVCGACLSCRCHEKRIFAQHLFRAGQSGFCVFFTVRFTQLFFNFNLAVATVAWFPSKCEVNLSTVCKTGSARFHHVVAAGKPRWQWRQLTLTWL